jgi:hypothetical protein
VQVKIAYWLTDVPSVGMANLVVGSGSQNEQYFDGYDTWDPARTSSCYVHEPATCSS